MVSRLQLIECVVCSTEMVRKRMNQRLCGSVECRRKYKTQWQLQWQKTNAKKHGTYTKLTRQRYPDLRRARRAMEVGRTRALDYGSPHEPYTAQDLVAMLSDGCHICGGTDGTLGWDHVVPLIRGGADALHNIRPAHWLTCNAPKHVKLMEEMA